jgi:hypothetical protein
LDSRTPTEVAGDKAIVPNSCLFERLATDVVPHSREKDDRVWEATDESHDAHHHGHITQPEEVEHAALAKDTELKGLCGVQREVFVVAVISLMVLFCLL